MRIYKLEHMDETTLSGCETFLASLSLGLVLSTQIQLKEMAPFEALDFSGDVETLIRNPWFGKYFEDLFHYAESSGIDKTDPD